MDKNRIVFYFLVVAVFLCIGQPEPAGASGLKTQEVTQYVERVLADEAEFALKSPANKDLKGKKVRKGKYHCMEGHWRARNDRAMFLCD